jgi:hypothetical protein
MRKVDFQYLLKCIGSVAVDLGAAAVLYFVIKILWR